MRFHKQKGRSLEASIRRKLKRQPNENKAAKAMAAYMTDQNVDDFLMSMIVSSGNELREWLYEKFGRAAVVAAIAEDDDEE
jgi:hypothetical protein